MSSGGLQESDFRGSNFVSSKIRERVRNSRDPRLVVCQKWTTDAHWLDLAVYALTGKGLLPQGVTAPSLVQAYQRGDSFWHG